MVAHGALLLARALLTLLAALPLACRATAAGAHTNAASIKCSAPLANVDFNGHDLPGQSCTGKASSAAACCEQCGAERGCSVWTWIPGASVEQGMSSSFGGSGTCCFKVSAEGRRTMQGYISGCVESTSNGTCLVPIPPTNRPPPTPPPAPPPPRSPPPPPCRTDEDCSLNGVCTSGTCHCDPGWTTLPFGGPWCGFLDFLPSPISKCGPACAFHGGEGGIDVATTSWGGSVIGPSQNADGKYWMFAAEMAQHCTLGQWTTNSQVVTAVSDTPLGPFVRQAIAIPPWSHNPEAIRTPDGTYVIFTLGPGKGLTHEKNCTKDGAVPLVVDGQQRLEHRVLSDGKGQTPPRGLVNFTVHSAPNPRGPWTATTMQVYNWNITWDLETPGNWNPAPVVLPDGSVRVMAHTDWGENGHSTPSHKVGAWAGEAILEAPSWKGPYKVVGGDEIDHCNYCEEDPCVSNTKHPTLSQQILLKTKLLPRTGSCGKTNVATGTCSTTACLIQQVPWTLTVSSSWLRFHLHRSTVPSLLSCSALGKLCRGQRGWFVEKAQITGSFSWLGRRACV